MQDSQLLKFINGVSSKKFAGAQQYLQQWSTWLADQKWAVVNSTNDSDDQKLLEMHKAAVQQLIATKPSATTQLNTTSSVTKSSGTGNYVVEIWENSAASEPDFRKRVKHHVAAQDWAFAKAAEEYGNDCVIKIIGPDGKVNSYTRQNAIYGAWGKRKTTMAYKKVSVSSPNWEMRSRNSRASFSRG